MFEDIVKQFCDSNEGKQVVTDLQGRGFDPDKAKRTVQAVAESAAQHLGGGGGGLIGALGGGGAGGVGGAGGGTAGLPPGVIDAIATNVASRVGIDPTMARNAVNVILPRVMNFARGKMPASVGGS